MASFLTISMSTASSSSSRQVVGKCKRSGTREFRLENIRARNPVFFPGKVASVVAKGGSLFPRFRGSIGESCQQKVHRTVAIARFPLEHVKNWGARSTFGRWGRQNVHGTVARDRFHINNLKNCHNHHHHHHHHHHRVVGHQKKR